MQKTSNQSSQSRKYILNDRKGRRRRQDPKHNFTTCLKQVLSFQESEPPIEEQNSAVRTNIHKWTGFANTRASKELSFQIETQDGSPSRSRTSLRRHSRQPSNFFKQPTKKSTTNNSQISTTDNSKTELKELRSEIYSLDSQSNCLPPDQPENIQAQNDETIEFMFLELEKLLNRFERPLAFKRGSFIPYKRKSIKDQYEFREKLGEGAFGTVFKCIHMSTKAVRTVKIIKNSKMNLKMNRQLLKRKISILQQLDHPNVIKMYEVYEYDHTLYIVLQYCDGGSLKSYMSTKSTLSPELKQQVLRQILTGLNYIHHMKIIHRDVKPENILFSTPIHSNSSLKDVSIKLIDFGLSIPFEEKYFRDWNKIGSLIYMAPEVFHGLYSTKCDSWGCGILAHMLLLGSNPFFQDDATSIFQKIQSYKLDSSPNWSSLSTSERQVLCALLNKNHIVRKDLKELLQMSYFDTEQKTLTDNDRKKIGEKMSSFKRSGCNLIDILHYYLAFTRLPQTKIKAYGEMFNCIDSDSNGLISENQLSNCLPSIEKEQLKAIFKEIDFNESGFIDFGEFVCVMADKKELFSLQNIKEAFNLLDPLKAGVIGRNSLKGFLSRFIFCGRQDFQSLFCQIDSDADGNISETEFTWFVLRKIYFSLS